MEGWSWYPLGDISATTTTMVYGWWWDGAWADPLPYVRMVNNEYWEEYSNQDPAVDTNLNLGFGWDGAWIRKNFTGLTSQEDFQSYADEANVAAATLSGGTGWSGIPVY